MKVSLQLVMALLCFGVGLGIDSTTAMGAAAVSGKCTASSDGQKCSSDNTVLLQSKVKVEPMLTEVEGTCSEASDVNCCFTQAGIDIATAKVGAGLKVGSCAVGAKLAAGDQWKTLLAGLETCKNDACKLLAIPTSGTCAGYTCPQGMSQRTANYLATAACTNPATCEFNCCQTDVNADPVRRNGILTYSALWSVVNSTRISAQIGFPNGQADPSGQTHWGNEYLSDMQDLHDSSEGLRTVMNKVDATMAAKYCPGQSAEGDFTHLTHIKSCVDESLCVMAANEKTEEDIKTITMLREYYGKFEDITWDHLWTELNLAKVDSEGGGDKASPFSNKDIDFMSAAEIACHGITGFMDALNGSASLAQMDTQSSAYQISAVLVDAAKTTHALLDSVGTNSSMDVTLAALHRAWEQPCKMLNCDNTNYWDLLGASFSHSVALIEAGASAHHMHMHVRTRGRLEVRMQYFLASEEGRKYASNIYRVDGSTTEARMTRYVSFLKDNLHQVMTNHPKKYGLDYTLLSLYDREHMKKFFKTPVQSRLLQAHWDQNLYMVDDVQDLDQLAEIQALRNQEEELSDEDEERLEKMMKKTLILKAIGGVFQDVGKGIASAAKSVGSAVVSAAEAVGDGIVTAANAVKDVATNVAQGAAEIGKAIGKGIVTGVTALGEAVVTITTALGDAIVAFVDFVLSALACLGAGTVAAVGYAKKFPCPPVAGPLLPGMGPIPCPTTVGVILTFAVALSGKLGDLLTGKAITGIGIVVSVVVGFIPGTGMTGGLRIGVGISLNVMCSVEKGCLVEISVGAVASVVLPRGAGSPRCVMGKSFFGFGCAESFGLTLKLLCCSINFTNGCQSCGKGGCDSAGGKSAPSGAQKTQIDKAVADSKSCDETLTGNGHNYRGCQTRSTSGKECQKWSSQYPHTHNWGTKATNNQNGLGDHAICRNPDSHPTIWCYTKDPNKGKENCETFKGAMFPKLENGGGGGYRRRMKECQGDCDNNGDCATGMICHERDHSDEWVPGCQGGGAADIPDHDYCTKQWLASGGDDGYRRRMKACQGDCDNNGDCATGTECFQRDHSAERVPNCGYGGSGDKPDYDYCFEGKRLKQDGAGGYRRRMSKCQGDCDNNGDCDSGTCFQRDHSAELVPGCFKGGDGDKPDYDYCS